MVCSSSKSSRRAHSCRAAQSSTAGCPCSEACGTQWVENATVPEVMLMLKRLSQHLLGEPHWQLANTMSSRPFQSAGLNTIGGLENTCSVLTGAVLHAARLSRMSNALAWVSTLANASNLQ